MEIREISDKNAWENFFENRQEKTFLQSWNWGEAQKRMGNKIWRLGVYEKEQVLFVVLVVKIAAKRGVFLLIQHLIQKPKFGEAKRGARREQSPLLAPSGARGWRSHQRAAKIKNQNENSKFKILEILLAELKKIGQKERASFIRVAPLWEYNEENNKIFRSLGFRKAPMHASAYEATLKLDITLPEESLLNNMRKTTRYLIRQAKENKDIVIDKSDKIEDADLYNNLIKETAVEQGFVPFASELVKSEFEMFSKDNQALLFLGKYKEELVAAALIIFWSGIAFYHQAALHPKYRKIPAAYLLQWEAIKEAKKRGCKTYDFWGYVDPQKYPKHPWAGPSFFKAGFGGTIQEYIRTQDLPLSKKYWLTYVFEKLRRKKRGL